MAVRRIVANLPAADPRARAAFYTRLLGLETVMDAGWIVTLASGTTVAPQVSFAREGGSGLPVPALSIEVDDIDDVYATALQLGCEILHPLTDEPWGVRRFFARDPDGTIVNILCHAP